ncbi:MAG: Mrp/NBP35 family ATP-binding protein [Promethearchaeota archaeon]
MEVQYAIQRAMEKVRFKVAVISGKGGVGKTTVAVNLAVRLASLGRTVGLLDVDITGPNVAIQLGLQGQRPVVDPEARKFYPVPGPFDVKVVSMAFLTEDPDQPVIWRGPMKMSALRQFLTDAEWGTLDYLVVDLPPGTGDETLDVLQLIPDARPVIVTTPQDVALVSSRKTMVMVQIMKRQPLGIIENMSGFVCPHCGEETPIFGEGGGRKASDDLHIPFLGKVPLDVAVREQGDTGMPVVLKRPDSPAGKAFLEIAKKIMDGLERAK